MAESNNLPNDIYSENDTLDINELASLNNDITPEFIEQLQNQVSQTANKFSDNTAENDVSDLFEEIPQKEQSTNASMQNQSPQRVNLDENIDDNFIKKYKARLNKQQQVAETTQQELNKTPNLTQEQPEQEVPQVQAVKQTEIQEELPKEELEKQNAVDIPPVADKIEEKHIQEDKSKQIENLTGGNITEKPISEEQKNYNDSLDLLDNNVKYSKYVIYINPENTEFIESLTVKERKNLINRIIREQDDIAITKRRLGTIQTIIKHTIVAIITIALSIPIIYTIINASLEATINNHRQSQSLFKTLYKDTGKINVK